MVRATWGLFVCLIPVAMLVGGTVLVVLARPRRGAGHGGPACGNCGYNLTGSTTVNRCPECGKLFIEAGVVQQAPTGWRKWRLIAGIVLLCMPMLWMLAGFLAFRVTRPVRAVPTPVARPLPTPASAPVGSSGTGAAAPAEEAP